MLIRWVKKFLGWEEEEKGIMIEVDDPYDGLRVNDFDCCGICSHWACSNPLAWGWGTKEEPDGIGSCNLKPEKWLKYGGDWCEEFLNKEGEKSDG